MLSVSFGGAYSVSNMSSGRIAVPVTSGQALYANFEHVTGIPAKSGSGARIDKLKMLDTLIDRLESAKVNPARTERNLKALSPETIDAMIEKYEKEIRSAVAVSKPYVSRPLVEPGMMFSLQA